MLCSLLLLFSSGEVMRTPHSNIERESYRGFDRLSSGYHYPGRMAKMTMKQARAMRDGVLKGDSAIAKAWQELITGEAASPSLEDTTSASPGDRGERTLARMRALQDEGGF